ncbi:MAG: TAXI family TRAP transporter solute-binding subunit, partial [Bacillota bacterium]|nr:TAXI family TRAP transporter solute-binding subunit [Bacillota bacterium]
MKRRKLVVFLTLALAFILVMAGCSQPAGEVEGNGEAAGEVMELLMGTGGTGGTYYPLGGAIANVMSEWVEEVNVTIQATGASVENIRLLSSGEAELGMAMNNIAHSAWHDEGDFETEPVEKNWGAMGVVYPEIIQGFVA